MMPIVHTPTVGAAIVEFSQSHQRLHGVFLLIDNPDQIERSLEAQGRNPEDVRRSGHCGDAPVRLRYHGELVPDPEGIFTDATSPSYPLGAALNVVAVPLLDLRVEHATAPRPSSPGV